MPTNPNKKFSGKMDKVMHFFGQAAVAANAGEYTSRIVGNLVEIGDAIKKVIDEKKDGYDFDDLAWGLLGGWLEDRFDTWKECTCRKLARKFANGTYVISIPGAWFENPGIYD